MGVAVKNTTVETSEQQDSPKIRLGLQYPDQGINMHVDVPVTMNTPICNLLPVILQYLKTELPLQGKNISILNNPDVKFNLTKYSGVVINPDSTLAKENIYHGDEVLLTYQDYVEKFPALIDDQAEALATYLSSPVFTAWDIRVAQKLAKIALPTINAIISILVILYFIKYPTNQNDTGSVIARYVFVGVFILLSTSYFTISVSLIRFLKNQRPYLSKALNTSGYFTLIPATLLAVPGTLGAYSVLSMCCITLLVGVSVFMATKENRIDHSLFLGATIAILITGIISLFYTHSTITVIGELTVVSLIIVFKAQSISELFASTTLMSLPAAGENFKPEDNESINIQRAPLKGKEAIENIINQDEKAGAAQKFYQGLNTGNLLILVVCAFMFGYTLHDHIIPVLILVLFLPMALYSWGRYHTIAQVQGTFVCAAALCYPMFTFGVLVGKHGYVHTTQYFIAGLILSFLTILTGCIIAFQERKLKNPSVKWVIEWGLALSWLPPPIVLFILCDTWSFIRGLHL